MSLSKYKAPAAIAATIAVILVRSMLVANALSLNNGPRAGSEIGPLEPVPAEYVARLDKDGAHFTPDEAATAADGDAARKAVAAATSFLNFLSDDQAVYASLGDATHEESPQLKERTRVWVVIFKGVEVPLMGASDPEEKPVPDDFYVLVIANTMTAQYGGSFDD